MVRFQFIVRRKSDDDKLEIDLRFSELYYVVQEIYPGGLVAKKNDVLTAHAVYYRLQVGDEIHIVNGKTMKQNGTFEMKQEMAKAKILHIEVRRDDTNASIARVSVAAQRCHVDSQAPSLYELIIFGGTFIVVEDYNPVVEPQEGYLYLRKMQRVFVAACTLQEGASNSRHEHYVYGYVERSRTGGSKTPGWFPAHILVRDTMS